MRKSFIILLILIYSSGIFSQKKSDTTFLFKKTWVYKSYQKIFIDNNKNSVFIKELINATKTDSYRFDEIFKPTLDSISNKNKWFNTNKIATKWYPLYLYKGKYYLYAASDPGTSTWISITDNAFFQLYFDPGIVPAFIEQVNMINEQLVNIKLYNELEGHYTYNIHLIDEHKGLAVFEKINNLNRKEFLLMVREEKIKDYSIIVNYCKEQRTDEFKFQKIDYQKILSNLNDK